MRKPVYYQKFTFFDDPQTNVFFNQLYTLLCNTLTIEDVEHQLMIDGNLALLLQGISVKPQFIELCCASSGINNAIRCSIFSLPVTNVTLAAESIFFKANSKLVKINFVQSRPNSVRVGGITVRDSRTIKI